jgi:hypothetical protein
MLFTLRCRAFLYTCRGLCESTTTTCSYMSRWVTTTRHTSHRAHVTYHTSQMTYITCHSIAQHCTALHIALHIALHSIAQHCTALHSIAQHCTALHSIAQHCTALHSIAQHFTGTRHSPIHSPRNTPACAWCYHCAFTQLSLYMFPPSLLCLHAPDAALLLDAAPLQDDSLEKLGKLPPNLRLRIEVRLTSLFTGSVLQSAYRVASLCTCISEQL